MSNSSGWQVGTLVVHPKRPEWGPGKIVKVGQDRLHVIWRDLPEREAMVLVGSPVQRATDQHDAVLENLPPLIEKDGKLVLPTRRVTFEQALDKFRAEFPQGFSDPAYIGDLKHGERHYKWTAHEYYVDHLGNGRLRHLLEADLTGLVQEAERCIGKVNLLHVTEVVAFRDALQVEKAARSFFATLADLLDSEVISEGAFTPYARAVCDLPAERRRVATWTVATILPFLAQPDRHMFLKPGVTQQAAAALGFDLNYRPEPNWLTYSRLLKMADLYRQKLAPLQPRDLIDVQSFFWVTAGDRE